MSLDLKQQFTNIIKMNVYLFVEFVHSFNTKFETDYKLLLLETKVLCFYQIIYIL